MTALRASRDAPRLMGPDRTGAEPSLFPRDRTIRPRTSTPSVLMFPAALMLFSVTVLQSITTLALVLLMAMWSCRRGTGQRLKVSAF